MTVITHELALVRNVLRVIHSHYVDTPTSGYQNGVAWEVRESIFAAYAYHKSGHGPGSNFWFYNRVYTILWGNYYGGDTAAIAAREICELFNEPVPQED